jgi:hypothetical protein
MFHRFRCDYGHEWVLFSEALPRHLSAAQPCVEGHEAVTEQRETPVHKYYCSIIPAERTIESRSGGNVIGKGLYLVLVSEIGGSNSWISTRPMPLDSASEVVRVFFSTSKFNPTSMTELRKNT